mgnify:CR=1 FL=1
MKKLLAYDSKVYHYTEKQEHPLHGSLNITLYGMRETAPGNSTSDKILEMNERHPSNRFLCKRCKQYNRKKA